MSTTRIQLPRNQDQMRVTIGHLAGLPSPTSLLRRHQPLLISAALALLAASLGACSHPDGGRELYLESRANPIDVIEVAGETRVVTWPWLTGEVGTFAALPASGSRPLATRSSRATEFADAMQPSP